MPRAKKPVQPTSPAPGQTYGQGVDQQRAMKAVPLPDVEQARTNTVNAGLPTGPASSPVPVGSGAAPSGGAAPPSFQAALDAARMAPPPPPLSAGTATMGGSPVFDRADVWIQLAEMTGDPSFLQIAQRARLAR